MRGLLFGGLLFSSICSAQQTVQPSEMASSLLLKQARYLLENRKAAAAVPVLEEVLVRLQEMEDEDALAARRTALYQLGLCCLEAEEYEKAAQAFKRFVREYPEDEKVQEVRFLILEALAWQKDPDAVTSYVRQMKASGEFDELLAVLDKKNDTTRHTVLSLLSAYARTADFESWERFLPYCDEDARSDLNLNLALLAGGDLAVEQGEYEKAMRFYREVWLSDQLLAAMDRRLAALKQALEVPLPWVPLSQRDAQTAQRRAEEQRYEQMQAERRRLESGSYDQDVMLRMAQCYDLMGERTEALAIYERVIAEFPDSRAAERSRYGAFGCLAALERFAEAKAAAADYLERYTAGRYRDAMTLGLMQVHLRLNERAEAEALGLSLREQQPPHRYVDQVTFLLGTIRFEAKDYEAALPLFEEVSTEWPERIYAEAAVYWKGMCRLVSGDFHGASAVFEGYLAGGAWSPKAFEADATYRLAMARFGLGEDDAVRRILEEFVERFPQSDLCSEAWSMLGDLHGAAGDMEPALACYATARETAVKTDQLSYAVFQASQVFDLMDRQRERIALLRDYLDETDAQGEFARAVRGIAAAQLALGEPDAALETYAEMIHRFGNRADLSEADRLFTHLLAEVRLSRRDGITAEAAVRRLAPLQEESLADEQQRVLGLRLTALLALLSDGAQREKYDAALLAQGSPEELPLLPLRRFAEAAVEQGNTELAHRAFDAFMARFGSSDDAPAMVNVELRLLLADGRTEEALELARRSLAQHPDHPESIPTRLLEADALRLTGRCDEAIEKYREFASVRAWRGPLTPKALYFTGVCLMEQGKTEEACAWFQRVYVLYGGYPEWTAKAYAASFQCLEKLGRTEEARRTLREMVSQPELAATPEGRRAQGELSAMQEEPK